MVQLSADLPSHTSDDISIEMVIDDFDRAILRMEQLGAEIHDGIENSSLTTMKGHRDFRGWDRTSL